MICMILLTTINIILLIILLYYHTTVSAVPAFIVCRTFRLLEGGVDRMLLLCVDGLYR